MTPARDMHSPLTTGMWSAIWDRVDAINGFGEPLVDKAEQLSARYRTSAWQGIFKSLGKLDGPLTQAANEKSKPKRIAIRAKGFGGLGLRLPLMIARALSVLGARAAVTVVDCLVSAPAFGFLSLAWLVAAPVTAVVAPVYKGFHLAKQRITGRAYEPRVPEDVGDPYTYSAPELDSPAPAVAAPQVPSSPAQPRRTSPMLGYKARQVSASREGVNSGGLN